MKNKRVKLPKKNKKGAYEAKFEEMVKEYHSAQAVLGEMSVGSEEYTEQKFSVTSYLLMLSAFLSRINNQTY